MRLTREEHEQNARDFLALSSPAMQPGETVEREQLADQMQYTVADEEDIETIAGLIEELV